MLCSLSKKCKKTKLACPHETVVLGLGVVVVAYVTVSMVA